MELKLRILNTSFGSRKTGYGQRFRVLFCHEHETNASDTRDYRVLDGAVFFKLKMK